MKYVLDVFVAICWVIPRPLTPKADRLRDEYQRQIHELRTEILEAAEQQQAPPATVERLLYEVESLLGLLELRSGAGRSRVLRVGGTQYGTGLQWTNRLLRRYRAVKYNALIDAVLVGEWAAG